MTSPRLAAARVLVALESSETTLAEEVERERPELADRRDQALFLELAVGATRMRAALDARIAPHSRRPLQDLEPEIRAILRLAAYQLHHLDRVPVHALVHESVQMTRRLQQGRASGFVNAVLRSLVRRRQLNPLPSRPTERDSVEAALDYLSVTLSHPRWLVARWLDRHGLASTEAWCRFNNASPDVVVRPPGQSAADLLGRLAQVGIEGAAACAYAPNAVRLPAGTLGRLPADLRQSLIVQDEGSQLVAWATAARPGDRVLDVCAAPGGKTLLLAEAAGDAGFIAAADHRPGRIALLRQTLTRGTGHTTIVGLDAEKGLPFQTAFECVLLDAPCSGLGTLRRDPDIKWRRDASDLPVLAGRQRRMLAQAADAVRPGGSLLYATCSSEPEENDDVVAAFLATDTRFVREPVSLPGLPAAAAAIDAEGYLRTRPFAHGLDAYFAARLVRRRAT